MVTELGPHGHTKNRTSKESDRMFCSRPLGRPWTLRLTPALSAFTGDFDDDALPTFPRLMRFAMGSVAVYAVCMAYNHR
jgi:hypothetical protein